MQHTLTVIIAAIASAGVFVLGLCTILNPEPFAKFQRKAGDWQNSVIDLRVGLSDMNRDNMWVIRSAGVGFLIIGGVYFVELLLHSDTLGKR